jgi:hypothetical protein
MGLTVGPFRCRCGFIDAFQQRQHLVFDCSSVPPIVSPDPFGVEKQTCGFEGCESEYPDTTSMNSHFAEKHGKAAYDNPSLLHDDHTCKKGFPDARSLYEHMASKLSPHSHLDAIFNNLDVSWSVAYRDPSVHAYDNDILRSMPCYPIPESPYNLTLLGNKSLTVDDLAILWEDKLLSMQKGVCYPEWTGGRVAGSINYLTIMGWCMIPFTPNTPIDNAASFLSPLIYGIAPAEQERDPPSSKVLRKRYAHASTQTGVHLIFVYRHSREAPDDHERDHMFDMMQTASYIHNSQTANVVSVAVVCGRGIKGCFLPSFSYNTETEVDLASQSFAPGPRQATTLRDLMHQSTTAAEFTLRIKGQIIHSTMNGYRPVIVSMGTNAMSHNWTRLHLFHKELRDAYGDIDMWMRITFSEGRGDRDDTSRITCLKKIDGEFMGFYNSTDIVEHETGRVHSEGVGVMKVRLGA